jgi:hypothetical protein
MTDASGDPTTATAPRGRSRVGSRVGAVVAVVIVVAGGATYLLTRSEDGGSAPTTIPADAPTDASQAGFCRQYAKVRDVDDGRSVRDWADAMAKVGTPRHLPADARRGFELVLKEAARVDAHADASDLLAQRSELSGADQAVLSAFTEYAARTCVTALQNAGHAGQPS